MNVADGPTLYLLCGKIGAGKSTLARRLAARPGTLLISEDHWTSTLYADDLKTIEDYTRYSARLRAAMAPHIVAILGQGLSVVLDFPANTVRQREWMRALIAEAQVPHEFHLLDVPDEICRQRLHERNRSGTHPFQVSDAEFDQFTRYFVPPRPDEGSTSSSTPPDAPCDYSGLTSRSASARSISVKARRSRS